MKDLRIVFMGTPEFAVTILDGLINEGAQIVGVITAPDKPAGRGRKISESSVKTYSTEKGLTILQPTNLKDEHFVNKLKVLNADLFIVVAFRMLPEVIWTLPPKGTINLHASILPNFRGAAPINWAIINGEKESGVTTFFIEKEIDTGKIILNDKIEITEDMTAGQLHDKLASIGIEVMNKTIIQISENSVYALDQENIRTENIKSAPKIFKADCKINWALSATEVHNFIRGLSPYPGSWCNITFKGKELTCKLFNSSVSNINSKQKLEMSNQNTFVFPCADYYIAIEQIQIEGKRRMSYEEFRRGNSILDIEIIK
ncbi:methionyl-tRNA formyltransferase [Crocinitomicaceae bacterium]|nr:methionyl-tRNA formyltransferase [Crocinitomicaceae bacterium]